MTSNATSTLSKTLPLIVADENIPQISEALAGIARVKLLPGRQITAADVSTAEALFVRSITKVNKALLNGSTVKFVGSATIGMDHLATHELQEMGVEYTNAAGSNANSVVEYVFCGLLELHNQGIVSLDHDFTLGIIGVGNIGRALCQLAQKLGISVLCCDPPRQAAGEQGPWFSLDEVLAQSTVVSLHTPLTKTGPFPTHHMIGESQLKTLGPKGVLINAARGSVVQNTPLLRALQEKNLAAAVLDCWENEPELLPGLHECLFLGTPHIAGYSHDGKLAGTLQIVDAFCRFKGLPHSWKPSLTPPQQPMIKLIDENSLNLNSSSIWNRVLPFARTSYDLRQDDSALREQSTAHAASNPQTLRTQFDLLRKNYPLRREFSAYTFSGTNLDPILKNILCTLGFNEQ